MKIHGSISRHPKTKVKENAETKGNSAFNDGTAEVFAKSEGAGFEANLKAAINKSESRKTRENDLQSDDSQEAPLYGNNPLINDFAQIKPSIERGKLSDQSDDNSTGVEISERTVGVADETPIQPTGYFFDPGFPGKNNLNDNNQSAVDIPLSEPVSEISENADDISSPRLSDSSSVTTEIHSSNKIPVDAIGNTGLIDELNNKDKKSPVVSNGKESDSAQIQPQVTSNTETKESKPVGFTKVAGLVDSLSPQDNKSVQTESTKQEVGMANINSPVPEAAVGIKSNPDKAIEITAEVEKLVVKEEKSDTGNIAGVKAPKIESKTMGIGIVNTESLQAPEMNKSENVYNSTSKFGQIKPVPEDKASPKAEVIEGMKLNDREVSDFVRGEEGQSPVKEIERIGLSRPVQNIKRTVGESGNKDENNRPTNAANIHTASDKSAEKTSPKFSSEENLNGGKNKSGEKKLNSTPIEVLANKPNNAPIKLKSQHELNLPQERPVSLSQMNEELPRVLTTQANNTKSTMSFKLTPGSLGTLFVEVEISKGEVKAKFTAETKESQAAIEANMPALKEKLEEAGLKLTHSECGLERRDDGSASSDRQKRQSSQRPQFGSEFSLEPDKEEKTTPRPRTKGGSIIEEFV